MIVPRDFSRVLKMEEIIRTKLRNVEEFPSDLEGKINAIINIINTETKQIILAFCLDDKPKTRVMLRNEFESIVRRGKWVPSYSTFENIEHKTFVPIGFVAEEEIYYKGREFPILSWRITEAGKHFGKPISAYAMKWAVDNNISLYNIFGQTSSSGDTRAPFNRFQIISSLEDKILRNVDLSSILKLDSSAIKFHLESLKKVGIVNYESVPSEKTGWAVYEWKEGKEPKNVKYLCDLTLVTNKIIEYFLQNKKGNCERIYQKISYSYKTMISKILTELHRQGFLEATFIGGEIQSKSSLTEFGKKVRRELTERVKYALQNENELAVMRKVYEQFVRDFEMLQEYAGRAVDLYSEVSPMKNRRTAEEQKIRIMDFIRDYQEKERIGPRAKRIGEAIGIKGGFSATYLTPLVKSGKLRKYKEGNAARYKLTE